MKQTISLYSLGVILGLLTLQNLTSPAFGATSSIWSSSTVPALVDGGADSSVELGVKFRSDVSGTVTGIRFYKSAANTGTHVGNLWSSTGTSLASVTFTGETASGWQQMDFAAPVSITAGTVYVASYHSTAGHYSADVNYFTAGVDNAPLHALADGVSGGDGVYAYGSGSTFPSSTWSSANYWVDVLFQSGPAPTLTSIAVTPANPSIAVGATQQFTATGTYSDSSTQNLTSQATWTSSSTTNATINTSGLTTGLKAGGTTISAALSGVTGSTSLTVQSAPLSVTTTSLPGAGLGSSYSASVAASGGTLPYTWSISAGSLPPGISLNTSNGALTGTPTTGGTFNFTVLATDTSSPVQTATKALSIVVNSVFTIWPASTVPVLVDGGADSAVELGVKFRSDVSGNVTGIRFYKATANTGTHLGNLWSSTGTLLATVTFSGETASGWQQMNFSSSVAITAGTVYVASYHSTGGHYSADLNYFASAGVDNPPLHALANGVSGGDGVYGYGASSTFPTSTWNAANYWVDVVFQSGPAPTLTSIAVTPANPSIAVGATQQFTATGTYSDSSTQNLTSQATWTSSSTTVATISTSGLATGAKAGGTTISAALSGVTGSTTLTVQSSPLSITTTSLPGAALGSSYSASVVASGGTLPYTWSISAGSLPPGISLNTSSGALTGTPTTGGTFSFTVKVTDTSSPVQTTTKALSIVANSVFTIWPASRVPVLVDGGADSSVELGVKFRSDVSGNVTGIRFYKATANTGTHVGNLWSSTGTLLASVTFSGETASGWQQMSFSSSVAITAGTVYVASYHSAGGHYSADLNYFASTGVDNPPLHALANSVSPDGVYGYGTGNVFPTSTWSAANYWVDVVLQIGAAPTLTSITVTPANPTITAGGTQQFTATGTYSDNSTRDLTSQATWNSANTTVATVSSSGLATGLKPGSATISASLNSVSGSTTLKVQPAPLVISTTSLPGAVLNASYSVPVVASGGTTPYAWSLSAGSLPTGLTLNASSGVIGGNPTSPGTFNFTVKVTDAGSPTLSDTQALSIVVATATTPVLVLTNAANPFSAYFTEILSTEGMNEYDVKDISSISPAVLGDYDAVLLGQAALSQAQVSSISNWVYSGGKLVAMRPDKKLAGLLGLTDLGSTLAEGYILVNTSSGPGSGIVSQTIQFHGTADNYVANTASILATLFSDASTTTGKPAVTLQNVGPNSGQAAAFMFDLARSVISTRQGNPNWSGQDRDGQAPIRSDDLFFGPATFDPEPSWVDFNKITIPQADEQQRLLANMLVYMDSNKKLLPRFWYFPHGYKAAVVMTGDDHANGGTVGRFQQYAALSPSNGTLDDWTLIRGTSYVWPTPVLTDAQAAAFNAQGFEICMHLNTGCGDFTPASLDADFVDQLSQFHTAYPSQPPPTTDRIHCIVWSDYDSAASISLAHGIRLDTSYYYWPSNWVMNRPGMFTGSGMPMRFATSQGNTLDIFQAPSQMTDESGQDFPYTCDALLDKALGPEGYFGFFVANMHTDYNPEPGSDAILSSAMSRGVPIISARQLLKWLDARNSSRISGVTWLGTTETFSVQANANAAGLQVMVPVPSGYTVSSVKLNGSSTTFSLTIAKGIEYCVIPAGTGTFQVNYAPDTIPPSVSGLSPASGATGVDTHNLTVQASFSEPISAASVNSTTFTLVDSLNHAVPASVAYNPNGSVAELTPNASLGLGRTFKATVKGGANGISDLAGNRLPADVSWTFTTQSNYTIWPAASAPDVADGGPDSSVELGVKFRSDVAGTITGIRFYKAAANTGTHTVSLWNSQGTLLATATVGKETASGWQQASFSSPVSISSNTVYVASYHAPTGHYSADLGYFTSEFYDAPLRAIADGVSGGNGVYTYGSGTAFPTQTYGSANYWVDVLFKPAGQ